MIALRKSKSKEAEMAEDWDFSEGYGGIPEDVDLTKNIGCASNTRKNNKETKEKDRK